MKSARVEAITIQIAFPILGLNSQLPARIPIRSEKGSPMMNPTPVTIQAIVNESSNWPLKKEDQMMLNSESSLVTSDR